MSSSVTITDGPDDDAGAQFAAGVAAATAAQASTTAEEANQTAETAEEVAETALDIAARGVSRDELDVVVGRISDLEERLSAVTGLSIATAEEVAELDDPPNELTPEPVEPEPDEPEPEPRPAGRPARKFGSDGWFGSRS